MKAFTKSELVSLVVIFFVLVIISVPNFILSARRARDQSRRSDMGDLENALADYQNDFGIFPLNSPDGKILACKKPGDSVTLDAKGRLVVNLIPCEWGKDTWRDLTPGSSKIYMDIMPDDPDSSQGVRYMYFSDGERYQIYVSFEGADEAEYDKKIVERKINCGSRACNAGFAFGCDLYRTIEEYDQELKLKRLNKQ